jgi:hypothetical protein
MDGMNNVLAVAPAPHFRACLREILECPFEDFTLSPPIVSPPIVVTLLPSAISYVTNGNINAERNEFVNRDCMAVNDQRQGELVGTWTGMPLRSPFDDWGEQQWEAKT